MISPEAIQGHWVRHWIKAPGSEDHDTRVHWMQSGLDYADVRIPLARPDLRGATSLADLPAAALQQLARAEGFAGHVTLQGDTCMWHREINWHGIPDAPDVGRISFNDAGQMVEAGVLAEYTELWAQRGGGASIGLRFSEGNYSGVLVVSEVVAVLGVGQRSKPNTKPQLEALEAGLIPDSVDTFFDGLHAFCRVENDRLVAILATQPFAEGEQVLEFREDTVVWHKLDFDGTRSEVAMQVATVSA